MGGFYRPPDENEAAERLPEVAACRDDMCDLLLTLARTAEFPELDRDDEFLALVADDEYAMNLGRIKSSRGLDVDQSSGSRAPPSMTGRRSRSDTRAKPRTCRPS